MNREHPRLVGPALRHLPARGLCQGGEAVKTVFVAVLGMNALAGPEREVMAEHALALLLAADQVHLDAMAIAVIDRAVNEAGEVEIAAELAIDALQHIEIEFCGDAGGIVIGVVERALVLFQIDADDHLRAGPEDLARAEQKGVGLLRLEIA